MKSLITQLKVLLGSDVKFETVKTADGSATLEAESFEAGEAIFVVTDDGNIPAPVGTYDLEGGVQLVVEEEGIIAGVAPQEEMSSEEYATKAELDALKQSIEALAQKLSAQEAKSEPVEEESTEAEKLSSQKEAEESEAEMKKLVELAKGKPIKPNPEREQEQKTRIQFGNKGRKTTLHSVGDMLWG